MAQPPTIYKPGRLNNLWNYLGSSLKSFAKTFKPYLNSVTDIVDVTYDEMYNLCVNGKLTPGTKYRVPYKAVNFVNGWYNVANSYYNTPSWSNTITPGDVDGKFFTTIWKQGLFYDQPITSVVQDLDTNHVYTVVSNQNVIVKTDAQGNLISNFNVQFNDINEFNQGTITTGCIHQGGLIVINGIGQPYYYNSTFPVTYCKNNALIKVKSNGDLDYDFLNNAVGYTDGAVTQVKTFGPDNDKILVVGTFTEIGITSAYSGGDGVLDFTYTKPTGTDGTYIGVTVYTLTGSGNGANAQVYVKNNKVQSVQLSELGELYAVGDALYIDAGDFGGSETIQITVTEVRPKQIVSYMVALNADGTIYQDFMDNVAANPPYEGIESCFIDSNGDIVVGGNNGWIGKYSATGVFDATFDTNTGTKADGSITGIAQMPGGEYVIVGSFSDFDSNSVGYIAVLDGDGTYNGSFFSGMSSQFDDSVYGITPNGCIWGAFTDYDGTAANKLAKLDLGSIQNITPLDYRYNPSATLNGIVDNNENPSQAFVYGGYGLMRGPGGSSIDLTNADNIVAMSKIWTFPQANSYLDYSTADGIREVYVSNIEEHFIVTAATQYVTESIAYSEEFPGHIIYYEPWANKLVSNYGSVSSYNGEGVVLWDGTNPYIQILSDKRIYFGQSIKINIDGDFADSNEIDFEVYSVKPGPFHADSPYDAEVPTRYSRLQVSPDGKRVTFVDWGYDQYVRMRRTSKTDDTIQFYLDLPTDVFADRYGYVTRREHPAINVGLPLDWVGVNYRRFFVSDNEIAATFPGGLCYGGSGFFTIPKIDNNYDPATKFLPTTWYVDQPVINWNYKEEFRIINVPGYSISATSFVATPENTVDNIIFSDDVSDVASKNPIREFYNNTFVNSENIIFNNFYISDNTFIGCYNITLNAGMAKNFFYGINESIFNSSYFFGNNITCIKTSTFNTPVQVSSAIIDASSFINDSQFLYKSKTVMQDIEPSSSNALILQWYDSSAGGINYANAI